jgi:hypothetical protein
MLPSSPPRAGRSVWNVARLYAGPGSGSSGGASRAPSRSGGRRARSRGGWRGSVQRGAEGNQGESPPDRRACRWREVGPVPRSLLRDSPGARNVTPGSFSSSFRKSQRSASTTRSTRTRFSYCRSSRADRIGARCSPSKAAFRESPRRRRARLHPGTRARGALGLPTSIGIDVHKKESQACMIAVDPRQRIEPRRELDRHPDTELSGLGRAQLDLQRE